MQFPGTLVILGGIASPEMDGCGMDVCCRAMLGVEAEKDGLRTPDGSAERT